VSRGAGPRDVFGSVDGRFIACKPATLRPQLSVRPRHVVWFDQQPIRCPHHKREAYDVENSEADQNRDNDDSCPD
jgi:hypothetical protein